MVESVVVVDGSKMVVVDSSKIAVNADAVMDTEVVATGSEDASRKIVRTRETRNTSSRVHSLSQSLDTRCGYYFLVIQVILDPK